MHIQIIDEKNLAIYIEPPELAAYSPLGGEYLADLARSEFARISDAREVGELSVTAYRSAGGMLVFAERTEFRTERGVCVFRDFDSAARAAASVTRKPYAASLFNCEGRWYIEMYDESERLCDILTALCEFGRESRVGNMWLHEHGQCVCTEKVFGLLAEFA